MYNNLFNREKQEEMRSFFLELGQSGKHKTANRGEIIDYNQENIYIVIEGKIKQSLYSYHGSEKSLYILLPGEIFGEMDYFSKSKGNVIARAVKDSIIAIMNRKKLEAELKTDFDLYQYFIHSLTRKFRIVMLQMSDLVFNRSIGKLAHLLLRLSSQQGKKLNDKIMIDMCLTHRELASLIGCSRSTVSRSLKELREKEILTIKNKKIIINDREKLSTYINSPCQN